MREQVRDRHGQVVIRIEQPRAARHDAVAVVIGIAGQGEIEVVFQLDQARHGVGRGAIHADLAIPIDAHEAEGGVGVIVHDGQLEPIFSAIRPQ